MSNAITSRAAMAGVVPATATPVAPQPIAPPRRGLSRRQKAAIIVRLLLRDGAELPLDDLPEAIQVELTQEMGAMRRVDKTTLRQVIAEFIEEVNDLGASFPGGVDGALDMLGNALSPDNIRRLRQRTGVHGQGDPWGTLTALEPDELARICQRESLEVSAIILSKLPVATSAQLLSKLPGPLARKITYAVSTTATTDPETVRMIGQALALQIADQSPKAFPEAPVNRLGKILNFSDAKTRDDVLSGLLERDADFGQAVRRNVFTFEDIPQRVEPRDVPRIVRALDRVTLLDALAADTPPYADTVTFFFDKMSQRLADQLRDEINDRDAVAQGVMEAAMDAVITAIRDLERDGEIVLISQSDA